MGKVDQVRGRIEEGQHRLVEELAKVVVREGGVSSLQVVTVHEKDRVLLPLGERSPVVDHELRAVPHPRPLRLERPVASRRDVPVGLGTR